MNYEIHRKTNKMQKQTQQNEIYIQILILMTRRLFNDLMILNRQLLMVLREIIVEHLIQPIIPESFCVFEHFQEDH